MQESRLTGGSMASPALVREDGGPAFALRRTVNTIFAGAMFSRRSLIFNRLPLPLPRPKRTQAWLWYWIYHSVQRGPQIRSEVRANVPFLSILLLLIMICDQWYRAESQSPTAFTCHDSCARSHFLFIYKTAWASAPAFPAKFSDGQGSSDLQTQHSFSASIMGWGGRKSRWCEIDDLNTSSINAAADVVFGDWWRIQAIHLSNRQPSVKILRRFSVLFLCFQSSSAADCWSLNIYWQVREPLGIICYGRFSIYVSIAQKRSEILSQRAR